MISSMLCLIIFEKKEDLKKEDLGGIPFVNINHIRNFHPY